MKYLKDWGVEGWECTEFETSRTCDVKLYYQKHDKCNGFQFKLLEFSEQVEDEPAKYERIFDGIAYYDGLRHVSCGSDVDEDGYLHYPDPNLMVLVFQVLAELEKMYCQEDQL